jgi:hypothetical protein
MAFEAMLLEDLHGTYVATTVLDSGRQLATHTHEQSQTSILTDGLCLKFLFMSAR